MNRDFTDDFMDDSQSNLMDAHLGLKFKICSDDLKQPFRLYFAEEFGAI